MTCDAARYVATFYPAATPATAYLRCELPARYLAANVRPIIEYAVDGDSIVFPDHVGAAVFQLAADKQRAACLHHMQAQGVRVLVETDDNYRTRAPKDIRKRSGWGVKIGDGAHTLGGHDYICRHADGVIVTTDYLAAQYRKANPNVYVCPNTVDPADWPEPRKPDDGILRIAWAASLSHKGDIPLVTAAFDWASRQPGVLVYAVGLDPRWKFEYQHVPWLHDLGDYRAAFQLFDIGVAPVKADPFGLGRSDVKALEYAMGGCAPILSDVCCYSAWSDGGNCLKAGNASGFVKAVKHLVRNRGEAAQLASSARGHVLAERTTAAQIHFWKHAINPS